MKTYSIEDIKSLDKRFRATFINCLSGYKSPFLVGTMNNEGQENLAIFSSVFHLGANPPLIGMISRPNTVPRHTLENIRDLGEYSLNLVHQSYLDQAHQTSARYPRDRSEFDACGFTSSRDKDFRVPVISESALTIILKLREIKKLEINETQLVIGEIVKLIVRNDEALQGDGFIDFSELEAAACLGLDAYTFPKGMERKPYAKAT